MNRILKTILISGASALAGGIAGYIFCKKTIESKLQKQFENAVNEEIDKIRMHAETDHVIKNVEKTLDEYNEEVLGGRLPDAFGNPFKELNEIDRRLFLENDYWRSLGEQKVAYWRGQGDDEPTILQKLERFYASVKTSPEDDPDEEDDDEDPQEVMDGWAEQGPCVIPVEEYDDLPPYFERVTWHYFEEDDVLIDEGDMLVDDIEKWVGDGLVHFGEDPNDDDVVYIANGSMGSAIEIVRMHQAYSEWGA